MWFKSPMKSLGKPWWAWNGLAELYLSLGKDEKALDCLKRSLEVNANQPHVLSKIKEIQGYERGTHEGK